MLFCDIVLTTKVHCEVIADKLDTHELTDKTMLYYIILTTKALYLHFYCNRLR